MKEFEKPLFSVIIPSYNHARYIGRALQSVLDQTYRNWEVIVIDNNSTDNTDEVLRNFIDSRITYLKIHNNGVIAVSRNAGINASRGKWIAFLDSDDWWTADKLQKCFECLNDNVDLFYHDMEIASDHNSLFRRKIIKTWQVTKPVLLHLLINGNTICNSSVVVRKILLEKIGFINENTDMVAAEDYNAWLRIAKITNQFHYLPHRLGFYFLHNQGISQKDMTKPTRVAVAEFMHLLSERQKKGLEAKFRYTRGVFNCLLGNYTQAKDDLWFALWNGYIFVRIKELFR